MNSRECCWCWKSTSTPKQGGIHVQTLLTNAARAEGLCTSASKYLHVSCAVTVRRELRTRARYHVKMLQAVTRALSIALLIFGALFSGVQAQASQPAAIHRVGDSTALEMYKNWLARTTPMDTLPTVYYQWWNELRDMVTVLCGCADDVLIQSVSFATLPGFEFTSMNGRRAYASTAYKLSVVVAEDHVMSKKIVQHEMLHVLLQTDGHPEIFTTLHLRAEDLTRDDLATVMRYGRLHLTRTH